MTDYKKIIIGILILLISSSIIYIALDEKVRIRVDNDKTTFYIKLLDDNSEPYGRWLVAGREYNSLMDGSSKMNRDVSGITVNIDIDNSTNYTTIIRSTPYKRGPVIIDTYVFNGNSDDLELFPISHTVRIINGSDYYYRYEVKDLDYEGETRKLIDETKLSFGKRMKLELQSGYRWAWVYSYGGFRAQYDIPTDDSFFNVRLFDPIKVLSEIDSTKEIVPVSISDKDIIKVYTKTKDDKYGKISLIDSKDFAKTGAEYILLDNSDKCSRNCYAEGEAILYMKTKMFDDLLFKNKNNKSVDLDKIKISIKQNVTKVNSTPIYGEICNKTCVIGITGYKYKNYIIEEWVNVTGEILDEGFYEWRIDAKKKAGEDIDWIIDFKGILFDEWAWWNDAQANLEQYWTFDTPSISGNDISDSVNGSIATNEGADAISGGKAYQAFNFVLASSDDMDVSGVITDYNLNDFTMNMWFKVDGNPAAEAHLFSGFETPKIIYLRMDTAGKLYFLASDGTAKSFTTSNSYTDNEWYMATIMQDGINYALYIDKVLVGSTSFNSNFANNNAHFIGANHVGTETFDGSLDEIGIWLRNITVAEMEGLYDNPGYDEINQTVPPAAITAPVLNAPANTTTIEAIPNLNWTNSTITLTSGLITYYIEVDNNSDFTSPEYYNVSVSETVTPTEDTPSGLFNGYFYWRVNATNGTINSGYSTTWEFNYTVLPPVLAGNVTDGGGNTVEGVMVFALLNNSGTTISYNTTTNSSGGWVITPVTAGNYTVCSYAPNNYTLRGDCTPFIDVY